MTTLELVNNVFLNVEHAVNLQRTAQRVRLFGFLFKGNLTYYLENNNCVTDCKAGFWENAADLLN